MNAVNKTSSNTLTDATLLAAFHVGNEELEEEEKTFVLTCDCNLSRLVINHYLLGLQMNHTVWLH
jgi:hypothetical protein